MSSFAKQALILAAGRGSRMGGLTDDTPKCGVILNGHPLIYWQILSLKNAGMEKIAVVSGYCEDYFRSLPVEIDHIFHNAKWAESNMVWSMMSAREFLQVPTIISYSDIVYAPDVVRNLSRSDGRISISCDADWLSLWSRRFTDPLDDAETFRTDDHGVLLEIGRKPQQTVEIEAQYMGLLKFTPEIIQTIDELFSESELKNMHMTGLLDRLIAKGVKVNTVKTHGGWCEVDSEKDLEVANEMFHNGEILNYPEVINAD